MPPPWHGQAPHRTSLLIYHTCTPVHLYNLRSLQPPFVHPFGCNACPKSFTTAAAREEHYTAVHVGPSGRRFHCDLCPNKSFQVQKELHQHYKDTHPGRNIGRTPLPRAFICPSCSAQYQSKDCLEKHIQMTHSGEGLIFYSLRWKG